MKKILALLLVAVMSISMVACGEETTSAETPDTPTTTENESTREQTLDELLSTAVELDGYEIYQEYAKNKVKVTSEYENTSCMVSGNIDAIETDHIVVIYSNLKVNVYLPKEEIFELEKGQSVTVVGILENMSSEETMAFLGVTCDFNTGYVSKAIYTKTGIYKSSTSTDGTHPQGIYLECLNDSGKTYFVELVLTDEQKEALTIGAEVTLDGKMILNDNTMPHSAPYKLVVTEIK